MTRKKGRKEGRGKALLSMYVTPSMFISSMTLSSSSVAERKIHLQYRKDEIGQLSSSARRRWGEMSGRRENAPSEGEEVWVKVLPRHNALPSRTLARILVVEDKADLYDSDEAGSAKSVPEREKGGQRRKKRGRSIGKG
jgi:hypothetical protein